MTREADEIRTRCDGPQLGRLAVLHCRTIAVRMALRGEQRIIAGTGCLESDPDLGEVLRIRFAGHEDDGELLLIAAQWQGKIEPGESVGCDFLVQLT